MHWRRTADRIAAWLIVATVLAFIAGVLFLIASEYKRVMG
jgi:hypothetical protein